MLTLTETIVFFVLLAVALGAAFRELRRKARLVLRGRPVARFDRPLARIGEAIWRVGLQAQVFGQRPLTGFFHALIFWGFFVFALVTLGHVAEGILGIGLFGHGWVEAALLFGANLFAALIIAAVFYFLVRRYVFRASGLDRPSWQSLVILSFILVLMVSFVFYEAFKIFERATVDANFLALWAHRHLLSGPSLFWLKSLWWLHILVVMAFGVFITYSKHLHLIAGPVNILFKHNGPRGEIPTLNLEEQEKFGTPVVTDLTRKDLLDLFSCAECGRCEDVCPAFASGKPLSPKKLLHDLQVHLQASEKSLDRPDELRKLFAGVIPEEVVWDCTTCAACLEACPMFNEHLAKIVGMRQYAVMMESRFPEEFHNLFRGLENQGNPWGLSAEARADWAKGLDVPLMADRQQADVLLWVGCAGAYDMHSQKIARALVEVLQRAGVDFAWLGNEERCCGDPARRTGMEYLYQVLAQQNIETLNRYTFRRIVTLCPHGAHVLQNEYARLGGHYVVQHHAEFLAELVASRRVRLDGEGLGTVTFHDPCYLGRYRGVYEEPRRLLGGLAGARLTEMASHHGRSFCCGAGGGGMWKEEKGGQRLSHMRVEQARKSGAATLATACPWCSVMFKDAIDEMGLQGLATADLAQLVRDRLR